MGKYEEWVKFENERLKLEGSKDKEEEMIDVRDFRKKMNLLSDQIHDLQTLMNKYLKIKQTKFTN